MRIFTEQSFAGTFQPNLRDTCEVPGIILPGASAAHRKTPFKPTRWSPRELSNHCGKRVVRASAGAQRTIPSCRRVCECTNERKRSGKCRADGNIATLFRNLRDASNKGTAGSVSRQFCSGFWVYCKTAKRHVFSYICLPVRILETLELITIRDYWLLTRYHWLLVFEIFNIIKKLSQVLERKFIYSL